MAQATVDPAMLRHGLNLVYSARKSPHMADLSMQSVVAYLKCLDEELSASLYADDDVTDIVELLDIIEAKIEDARTMLWAMRFRASNGSTCHV